MKKLLFINFCLLALTCKADIITDSLYKNPSVTHPFLKDKDNSVELKRVTRVFTIATFSNEIGWASFMDDPHKGFEINYTKQKMSRILSKGISVGLQPISTLEQNVTLLDTLGVLKVRDQIVHGHITLRFSPLKFKIVQPYIDLIVGAQGSLLTSKFSLPIFIFIFFDISKFSIFRNRRETRFHAERINFRGMSSNMELFGEYF